MCMSEQGTKECQIQYHHTTGLPSNDAQNKLLHCILVALLTRMAQGSLKERCMANPGSYNMEICNDLLDKDRSSCYEED